MSLDEITEGERVERGVEVRGSSPGARQRLEVRTSRGLCYDIVSRAAGTKYHKPPKTTL